MSVFDKLKFWKHDEQELFTPIGGGPPTLEPLFQTGIEAGSFSGVPPAPLTDQTGYNQQSSFNQPLHQLVSPMIQPQPYAPVTQSPKEFEMLNSKLDSIKSMLENISLRLEKIEVPLLQKPRETPRQRIQEWRY
ncbi:MAG: hypothetical protein AABX52_01005 [Nanoarchaeota archaeon]